MNTKNALSSYILTFLVRASLLATLLLSASSCTTIQKDTMTWSPSSADQKTLLDIEERVVSLEKKMDAALLAETQQILSQQELKVTEGSALDARLNAWAGRIFLLQGNKAEAIKRQQKASAQLPGDAYSLVLGVRLVENPQERLELIESYLKITEDQAPLVLERALTLVSIQHYQDAVASFDEAFLKLPTIYRKTYEAERNTAFEMRAVTSDASQKQLIILSKNEILWTDVLFLTQQETQMFQFLTAGKIWTEKQLFEKLLHEGIFLLSAKPSLESKVSRGDVSYFFWQLTARNRRDTSLLTQYTDKMIRSGRQKSPIPDVDFSEPWFDSILGCVEEEILSLPDGRNFYPSQTIQGTDLTVIITNAEKANR